ncbi:MAG: ATP-binding cassette domain-containing protein [Thermoproteota archaeon]|jgi:daunorubicin resistance ABC transporter ATP-binding subunit
MDNEFDERIIVKAINLTKVFNNSTKAVDNISFEVFKGEVFGLLGPNGAGKTTTIKMLTTVLRPTSGTAYINGYDIVKDASRVRRMISAVPQEFTADEDLTGYENLILTADLYGIPREISKKRAIELLELVGLKDAAKRKVETYSGGMRRRLEIACGLINRPVLLFLDEPTLGLDVQTRYAIWEYVKKIKEEFDMTIFLSTHYLEEADSLCSRIAIIDHGRIVKIGSPEELKRSLGGDLIEIKIDTSDIDLSEYIYSIPGVKEVKKIDSTYRIKASSGEEVAPLIFELIRTKGYTIQRVSISKPSLDEAYLEITGRRLREEQSSFEEIMSFRRTIRRTRA